MADNLEKIDKRLELIEQRLSRLESTKDVNVDKIIDEARGGREEKQESSGPSFPVGALILLGLGGVIIWNSLPGFLSRMFFGSYNRYGSSYVDFGSLIFAGIGCALFVLGLRSILTYRDSKSGVKNVSKKPGSVIESARPLEMNKGGLGEKKEEDRGDSIEYQIASHWFSIVGVVAILLGVALFLKFAFDSNWIGPVGQVSIGVIFGMFLLGLGDFFRTKYAQYSQILSGCGLGVLYLSLWSAYSIFKLIDPYAVMGAMTLVTATAALLAIRYNSIYIAALGILGGFVTPLLLGQGLDQTMLLIYVLVLNLGVLLIAFFKNWKALNLLTFAATFIDFSVWYSNLADRGQYTLEAFGFLTVFFVVFSLVWVVYNLVYERQVEDVDILLSLLNAFVYFGFSFMILSEPYKDYMGFFAFAVAFYYAVFGFIAYAKFKADSVLTLGFLGTAILFLTIAVPLQVQKNLITIVWAIEGAVLVWLSFWITSYKLRVAALGIYILVVIRLVAFDSNLPLDEFTLIMNKRFITYVIAAISAGIAGYFYLAYKQSVQEDEKPVLPALLIGLNIVLVAALTLESVTYFDVQIKNLRDGGKESVLASKTVTIPVVSGADDGSTGCTAYNPNEVYIGYDVNQCQFTSQFTFRNLQIPIGSKISAATLSVYAADNVTNAPMTLRVQSFSNSVLEQADLTNWAYLAPYSISVTNVVANLQSTNQITLTLSPVSGVGFRRVFAYERGDLTRVAKLSVTYEEPAGSSQTNPYIQQPGQRNNQYVPPVNTQYQEQPYIEPSTETIEEIRNLENRRNISISIIWLAYSLVLLMVGVVAKYKPIRLSALAFFAVTILKVFLVDSSNLQQLYRIIAFIGLGTILLIVAYIYQRYKQQINAFLLNG